MRRPLIDADFSAVEARIVAWLAGQEDVLEKYRLYDAAPPKSKEKERLCLYRIMATVIYEILIDYVQKMPHRFVGKEAVLGGGFGMGPEKFRAQCLKRGYILPDGLEYKVIKLWRKKHDKIVKFWGLLDDAAKLAVLRKGEVFKAGQFISFKCLTTGGVEFLLMRLPSGRKLAYPWPRIVPGKFEGSQAVSFYQNLKGKIWGHNHGVWGGVWAENCTQAVAADLMANGSHNVERAGYEIATLIHDQALAYHKTHQTVDEFVKLLTDLPEWAKGLPLAAEGSLTPYYRKD